MMLIIKNGFFDLKAPVYMTQTQKEKLKKFMKETFDDVDFIDISEPIRVWSERDGVSQVRFSLDEMFILLQSGDLDEKMRKLREFYPGRKKWTVELKIGSVYPKFVMYMKKKKIKTVIKEIVKKFLEEAGML